MLYVDTIVVGSMSTNCYLLTNNELNAAVLIDPGDDFSLINQKLKDSKAELKYIILTHGHFDHIGAVTEFVKEYNPILIMNKNDYDYLTNTNYNLSCNFSNNVTAKYEHIRFVGDESANLLGFQFSFIHTPGHTLGSMCIKVQGNLFTGDTLFFESIGNDFPPFGNINQEINSIRQKLYSIPDDLTCYPGHGNLTSLHYEMKYNPYTRKNDYGY